MVVIWQINGSVRKIGITWTIVVAECTGSCVFIQLEVQRTLFNTGGLLKVEILATRCALVSTLARTSSTRWVAGTTLHQTIVVLKVCIWWTSLDAREVVKRMVLLTAQALAV